MSTYIYKNDCLYADTRKIINFPGGAMSAIEYESKVFQHSWCYLAYTGFAVEPIKNTHVLKVLTCLESLDYLEQLLKDHAPELYDHLSPDLSSVAAMFTKASLPFLNDIGFLAVTRRQIYGLCSGTLKDERRQIHIQSTDSVEVIGSSQSAAQILLLNGVPPSEIYPILRKGHAPTGEVFETFDRNQLASLVPPWSFVPVWTYIGVLCSSETPKLFKQRYLRFLDLAYLVAKAEGWNSDKSQTLIAPKVLKELTETMPSNEHRKAGGYQRLLKNWSPK